MDRVLRHATRAGSRAAYGAAPDGDPGGVATPIETSASPCATPAREHRQDENFDELLGEPQAVSVDATEPAVEPGSCRLYNQHRAGDDREPRPPSAQQRGCRSE